MESPVHDLSFLIGSGDGAQFEIDMSPRAVEFYATLPDTLKKNTCHVPLSSQFPAFDSLHAEFARQDTVSLIHPIKGGPKHLRAVADLYPADQPMKMVFFVPDRIASVFKKQSIVTAKNTALAARTVIPSIHQFKVAVPLGISASKKRAKTSIE